MLFGNFSGALISTFNNAGDDEGEEVEVRRHEEDAVERGCVGVKQCPEVVELTKYFFKEYVKHSKSYCTWT